MCPQVLFSHAGSNTYAYTVRFKTKLTFCNCKNNVIAIVVTIERTIFTDVLRLVITIIRNVITYVAINNVVISVATYIPIQPALFIAGDLLALRCQLSCVQVLYIQLLSYVSKKKRGKGRYQKRLVTRILPERNIILCIELGIRRVRKYSILTYAKLISTGEDPAVYGVGDNCI